MSQEQIRSRVAEFDTGLGWYQDIDQATFYVEARNVDVDFRVMDLYDLPDLARQFDLVFCVGILYHCRDILRAVHSVSEVCRSRLILETAIEPIDSDLPLVRYSRVSQFSPAFEGGNGLPGHWHPNFAALEAFFDEEGFAVKRLLENGRRGGIVADRPA